MMAAIDTTSPTLDRECPGVENTMLRCSVDGGTKTWRGVHDAAPHIPATHCPADSVPWRAQAVCNNNGGTQCFKTHFENIQTDAAVCIVPIDADKRSSHATQSPESVTKHGCTAAQVLSPLVGDPVLQSAEDA